MSDSSVPKQCRLCGQPARPQRRLCYSCTGKIRRAKEATLTVTKLSSPLPTAAEVVEAARARRESIGLRARVQILTADNERLQSEIDAFTEIKSRPPDVLVYRQSKAERVDAVACSIASDWHVEERVDKAAVHGLNEYNLEIAQERSERYFRNLLRLTDIMARDSKINTIYISILGDFFSGWIHEELLASTLLAPGDAARFCAGLWISGIDFLLRESSYLIEADCIPGNHGRMTHKVHFSDPTGTSLETFMYHMIASRYFDNPRVRLNVASQSMVYRKFFESFVLRQIHGYETKYLGGVGGLTIPLNKAIAQWDKAVRADLTVLGHYHQFFDGGRFVANGSMIGMNLYAQQIKAEFEEPRQAFMIIHARHGGQKATTAPIWLTK